MGTSIKEPRETISTIGDRAKCSRLKEELQNLGGKNKTQQVVLKVAPQNLHMPQLKGITCRNSSVM